MRALYVEVDVLEYDDAREGRVWTPRRVKLVIPFSDNLLPIRDLVLLIPDSLAALVGAKSPDGLMVKDVWPVEAAT